MKCRKCGGSYPCSKHTIIIEEKTGNIIIPEGMELNEKNKQRVKDIRNVLKDL